MRPARLTRPVPVKCLEDAAVDYTISQHFALTYGGSSPPRARSELSIKDLIKALIKILKILDGGVYFVFDTKLSRILISVEKAT
ncbi:hypothetical protein PG996_012089 [Apiospora saccharicola]|uniref:Uncharacterized protein n=1 Tax=Apiospora saccharicola TaxID=335842 RepID=A0ABR1U499_9PEZI